jgi:hypothetical protein
MLRSANFVLAATLSIGRVTKAFLVVSSNPTIREAPNRELTWGVQVP